nr:hypothetical protein HmN_000902200 [Hymenolepis microstoma]
MNSRVYVATLNQSSIAYTILRSSGISSRKNTETREVVGKVLSPDPQVKATDGFLVEGNARLVVLALVVNPAPTTTFAPTVAQLNGEVDDDSMGY